MDITMLPFNVSLLPNDRKILANLEAVTSVDIYEGGNQQKLDNSGLFSPSIFGRPTESRRQRTFAYINLSTSIIHPLLYKNIER